jgi:hypothetical protein
MMGCNLLLLSIQTIAMSPLSPNYNCNEGIEINLVWVQPKKKLLTNKKIVMDVQIINYENLREETVTF